jgi:hypothetical protein
VSPADHTIRVVRGCPTDAELSALLTVLLALAGREDRPARVDRPGAAAAPVAMRCATGWAAPGFPGWAA